MTHPGSLVARVALVVTFLMIACAPVAGQQAEAAAQASAIKSSASYEELYQRYLVSARRAEAGPGASIAWMTGLTFDKRARRLNDLVTIRIVESISASGTADANLAKDSTTHLGAGREGAGLPLQRWSNDQVRQGADCRVPFHQP